jgi:hypothetical protein
MSKSGTQKKNQVEQRQRAVNEVLDSLERWSQRIGDHFTQKRESARKPFREKITVYIPESAVAVGEAQDQVVIQPWTRNISQSGISFVHADQIEQSHIIVCLNPPGSNCIYLDAEIVRRRPIQNGFWEFGAEFRGRANM